MRDFNKVVHLGTVNLYGNTHARVFCKIEYKDGRLSISGVEGPLANGDALGSCGQIDMSLRGNEASIKPAEGWDLAKLQRFFEVWHDWHLNDMKPYDAEMKAAGWDVLSAREMLGYRFMLTTEVAAERREAEQKAVQALREGGTVKYGEREQMLVNLPYELIVWKYADEPEPQAPEHYTRRTFYYGPNTGAVEQPERKRLGWLYPKDHPDGLLTRKLREDGPGYGSKHFTHPVPQDVLDFLQSLPASAIKPAWV